MKLMVVVATVLFSAGNALAQQGYSFQSDTQTALPTVEECLADLNECREKLGAETGESMDLLLRLAERLGFASVDDMLTSDCRSRRGTWSNGECTCTSPNSWFTEESQECCVDNARAYSRRQESCRESGGNWSCRGGCHCPLGTQLLDGRCQGDAATRDEIDRMRNRIPELEADVARVQGELDAAREEGDGQADQISDLEGRLEAAQNALDELRDLLSLREQQLRDALGTVPPAPLPGTAEAIAEVAGGTAPGPLEPTPPPEAEEGNWCTENGWACAGIIIGALAGLGGLTVGIVEATRDIEVTQQ